MALFSRDNVKARRGGGISARGGFRGIRGGKGRGRGRAGAGARAGNRSTFYSTRVEEDPTDFSRDGGKELVSDSTESDQEPSATSSDSDDPDGAKDVVKPYNALLQTLNANIRHGEPEKKKRRFERIEAVQRVETLEDELDEVEDTEEVEDLGTNYVEDADEIENAQDPFSKHLAELDETKLLQRIQDVKDDKWSTEKSTKQQGWSCSLKSPSNTQSVANHSLCSISSVDKMMLKQKLKEPAKKVLPSLDSLTGVLAFSIFHYQDILFSQRSVDKAEILRKLASLHVLNHVFKTRDRVIKDNARLIKENAEEDVELRDQGFTRPKVLMVLPTRQSCVKYIDNIIALCEPEQQENKKRFLDSYSSVDDHFSEEKAADFRELFAGNDDDMFRLGLKFTRKTVKFFARFYNSDIIFASPLGLRMALGADDPKKQDHDFLSSIEIVIVDQADAIFMQNWEHIEYIFEHLNLQPKEAHGCDFSRVRNWYLDGNARYVRQTILLSAFNFPALNKLYSHYMLNVAGKVKYLREEEGAMIDLSISPRQTFSRFNFLSLVTEPDDRFKYFSTAVVPPLTKSSKHGAGGGQGVLIYLPSYADFVRLRNYLATSSATQDISFGSISEYTSVRDVARARSHFLSGRHSVLLYTERAHHFRRYRLKGVKKIIMYGLPENPIFYKEIVGGFLSASIAAARLDAREASVRTLFSKLDMLKLERTVGTTRYLSMLREKGGDSFDFT
ncbi:rRNA-binding ribosome biosynthesis protein utp25 [Mycoblastus sanguinarius]|nr:rRNA-binding ribosome biosynthesis protein utp25 [Mycoblastus sanguinarius]